MEIVCRLPKSLPSKEQLVSWLSEAYANEIVRCQLVPSDDNLQQQNILCVTAKSYLIEFSKSGKILRGAKLPEIPQNLDDCLVDKFVSSDNLWYSVAYFPKPKGLCFVYLNQGSKMHLKLAKRNVSELKVDDFRNRGSQQLQFKIGEESVITDFNDGVDCSVEDEEDLTEPVVKAMRFQTETFKSLLHDAIQEMNEYRQTFESACDVLAAQNDSGNSVSEKHLLTKLFGESKVKNMGKDGKSESEPKFEFKSVKYFQYREKFAAFYEVINVSQENISIDTLKVISKARDADNPVNLSYETKILTDESLFPKKQEEDVTKILQNLFGICDDKAETRVGPSKSTWIVQIFDHKTNMCSANRVISTVMFVGEDQLLTLPDVTLPQVGLEPESKSFEDVLCLMRIFSKYSLRIKFVMTHIGNCVFSEILTHKLAFEKHETSMVHHRLFHPNSYGDLIVVLPENAEAKKLDFLLFSDGDKTVKQFLIELYSSLADDVEVTLVQDDQNNEVKVEDKIDAIKAELSVVADILKRRERPSSNVPQATFEIRSERCIHLLEKLNQLELETDRLFTQN